MIDALIWILIAALAVGVIVIFNRLVARKHYVREAWSGIDVQLKRRHDLIPKLVDTVKSYGRYEQAVLTEVTELRRQAGHTRDLDERAQTETGLSQALQRLIAIAEAYPDLKASKSFLELQKSLSEIEEQIQYARRYYNGTVRNLNILIQSFPSNVIARMFRFREAEYFELELVQERQSPEIN